MKGRLRFADWPLRWKMAVLLLAASLLPLGISVWVDTRQARDLLFDGLAQLMQARGDQIVRELDAFNLAQSAAARRLALTPAVRGHCAAIRAGEKPGAAGRRERERDLRGLLAAFPASDGGLRGAAVIGAGGRVLLSSLAAAEGADLSMQASVRAALGGRAAVSDIFLGLPGVDELPTLAFVAPVAGEAGCAVALWADGRALWQRVRASHALAGAGSFASIYDSHGIRIAHTASEGNIFHPAGPLPPATIDALAAERRFGPRTRELLTDVRAFAEQFERARADRLDGAVFRGFAPSNGQWNYGVARRLASVPWTVFYMAPQATFEAPLARLTRQRALLGATIMAVAVVAGFFVARSILAPASALLAAAAAIAAGDLAARVRPRRRDELGRLGLAFDAMAERVQAQDADLRRSRDTLDGLVRERTAELRDEIAERSRAEASATESRELLQAVIDHSGALIYAKDADGRFVLVNRQLAATFRHAPEDFIGRTDHDFFPAEAADTYRAMDLRVIASGQTLVEEEVVPTDDGAITYMSVKCPLRDAGDRIRGIVGISTDISDLKRAESRLRDQLERMQLLDQLTAAIAERQDPASIYQVLVLRLEAQLPADFACVCRHDARAGRLTVLSTGRARGPVETGGAQGTGVAGGGKGAGTAAAPVGADGPPTLPADDAMVTRALAGELSCEHDIAALPGGLARALAAGGLRSLVVGPLVNQGEVFGMLIVGAAATHAFGSGACEFLRQLSAHVALAARQAQLHGALQRAYDDLRQTQQAVMQQERLRALGQMASGIAHDINNAISPVALYTEALLEREPALTGRGRGYLQTIARAIEDVAETVARMREFYREREPQLELRPVRLDQIAGQVIDLTRVRWSDMPQQRGAVIDLVTDFAPEPPQVLGIESELREALTNLVFNAVDAMPAGGRLTLRVARMAGEPPRVALEVADTGIGMDDDTRRRCLEPFFTTKGERGTGLGLAMVYGVAQRQGAAIEIDSAPGQGTTMRLVFPVPVERPAEAAMVLVEARPDRALRLLIVDDDPLMLRSVRDALELDGHEVVEAGGGQIGIDLLREAAGPPGDRPPFDALITDLGMPHVDGRRVAAAARALWPALPVILLTGWGQRMAADGECPPDVDRVLAKPPRLRELRATLAELTGVMTTTAPPPGDTP